MMDLDFVTQGRQGTWECGYIPTSCMSSLQLHVELNAHMWVQSNKQHVEDGYNVIFASTGMVATKNVIVPIFSLCWLDLHELL